MPRLLFHRPDDRFGGTFKIVDVVGEGDGEAQAGGWRLWFSGNAPAKVTPLESWSKALIGSMAYPVEHISYNDISVSAVEDAGEDAVDSSGKEFPLFFAALEFGSAFCGDSVGFPFAPLADEFRPAFEPARFFHLGEQGIERPKGGLQDVSGEVCQFLPDPVAVHGAAILKQCQNKHSSMPLYHFTINISFHVANISLYDIYTSRNPGGLRSRGLECRWSILLRCARRGVRQTFWSALCRQESLHHMTDPIHRDVGVASTFSLLR